MRPDRLGRPHRRRAGAAADVEHGLTGPQFAALLRLSEAGRATQNQLGRLAAMDYATVQGVVRRLAARGLLRAAEDPLDRQILAATIFQSNTRDMISARGVPPYARWYADKVREYLPRYTP